MLPIFSHFQVSLSCEIWSEFNVDTVLSRTWDPPSRRDTLRSPPPKSFCVSVLSTTVADSSMYYRGDTGQMAILNPQLMSSEAFCVLNAWTMDVMAMQMTVTFYWTSAMAALEPRMSLQQAQRCSKYFDAARADIIITLKLHLYRQWHFKSFSYRTVTKSHQIISVTPSRGTN